MKEIKAKLNNLTQKPVLTFSMGCLFLLCLAVFITYYLRVIYSPRWMGQISFSLILFAVFTALWGVWFVFRAARNKDMPLGMAVILFVLGVIFTFATPVNQVPDENTHFLRGVEMAYGEWGFDENFQFSDDINLLMECFPAAYNNGYPAKDTGTVYDRYTMYADRLAAGDTDCENISIIIFQVLPYIPLCIGIFIAKMCGMNAMGMFFAGRLANVIFFTVCAYFSLKMRGKFRVILFALMAMPLMTFMYASCNSDAVLFALMFLMAAAILSDEFDTKKYILFTACLAVAATCKRTYIVFLPLLFAVSDEKWNVKTKTKNLGKITAAAVTLLAFVVVCEGTSLYVSAFSNYGEIERTMSDTSISGQLIFILKNPLRYRAVFADTLKNNAFFLFSGGLLGYLDVKIPLVNYLSPVLIIFIAANQRNVFTKEDTKKTVYFFIVGILTYAAAMTGLYLSWTPVTLPQIIGMQERYVYPAFIGFAMAISQFYSKRTKPDAANTDRLCIGMSYVFCVIAAALMLIIYYLPERAAVFVA